MTRLRTVAVVALLVLAAISGPGVGGAAAVEECTQADTMVWLISGGFVNEQCDPVTQSDTIGQMEQNQQDVTEANVAQGALEIKSSTNTFVTSQNNSLQNWQTPLYAAGQAAAVKVLQNGSTVSEAQAAANATIDNRTAVKQANLLSAWNNQIRGIQNLVQMRDSGNISSEFIYQQTVADGGSNEGTVYRSGLNASLFVNTTTLLANGSTRQVTYYIANDHKSTNFVAQHWKPWHNPTKISAEGFGFSNGMQIGVKAPPGGSEVVLWTPGSTVAKFPATWNKTEDISQQTKANLAPSIESISNAHAAGANWSELINPSTLAQEYATNYSSTGHWSYALATAAASGYALPDLNETSTMTVSYDGATYEGAIMSQQAPSGGTWEVGTTYNSSQIPGSQIILTTEGEHVDINGEFTITSMTDKTGSALNSTTSQTYVFEAANNEEYYQMMDELNELREEIKQREPTTGGGSGGGGESSGGSSMTAAAIGGGLLLVALGGVFLYGRSS
ncbi:hypothetical protein [Halocalculus aciditolerans]|uniref:Envelope protein N-terminal domain-containing protein n=1 Tax=Halocalculus aciditolerans TaxID=1383812 RepID=A0A830FBQ6_9EURY|nr:hypothetical protein [Halocalculus aciditolerans]GGL73741.1 hypothetical protein GCM10009039_34820 [Halocalculus aciditolerans]